MAERLQKAGLVGQTVTFQVKSADFDRYSRQTSLSGMTDRAEEIEATALYLADHLLNGPEGLFDKGLSIRLIGVGVSRLTGRQMQQMDLFAWAEQNEQEEEERKAAEEPVRQQEPARQAEEKAGQAEEKRLAAGARQEKLNAMMDQINGRFGSGTVKKGK